MIFYNLSDGDAYTVKIDYAPRTCFIMTQMGQPVPQVVAEIRDQLEECLADYDIHVIDANSVVTGRDFLIKIWRLILAVPLGIAIIHHEMSAQTLSNIFYEVGMLQAYGKESLVIKSEGTHVPSDFVRTEYLEFNNHFAGRIEKYLKSFFQQADYYISIADQVENNPLLAIDYLRRAYLISGEEVLRSRARQIFEQASIQGRAKNSVEMLLVNF